jgi:hypothetical protein
LQKIAQGLTDVQVKTEERIAIWIIYTDLLINDQANPEGFLENSEQAGSE